MKRASPTDDGGRDAGARTEVRVVLRPVADEDIGIFFEHQRDPVAHRMAAFTATPPEDRASFDAYWARRRSDSGVIVRTIEVEGLAVGYCMSAEHWGQRQVAYWIGREHWGGGIASAALALFLEIETRRPLGARAVRDNAGSIRVLEKCGFVIVGEEQGVSKIRLENVDEVILTLR